MTIVSKDARSLDLRYLKKEWWRKSKQKNIQMNKFFILSTNCIYYTVAAAANISWVGMEIYFISIFVIGNQKGVKIV